MAAPNIKGSPRKDAILFLGKKLNNEASGAAVEAGA